MVISAIGNSKLCKAHARLIAAAPDLYEACKSFIEDDDADFPSIDGYNKAINAMKAAITKIEGK